MIYYVYILQSLKNGRFYIGYTSEEPEDRLHQHNDGYFGKHKYTYRDRPWSIFHLIICTSLEQAKAIEKHIKKMKSSKYIQNLKKHPEISEKLLTRFQ